MFNIFGSGITAYQEISKLKIKDVMTREVVTLQKTSPLTEAAHLMIGAHISSLIIIKAGQPVGILTERDFIKKLDMTKNSKSASVVEDLVSKNLVTLTSNDDIFTAHKIMREHKFRKIVVVDNGTLSGIITQSDLCRITSKLKSKTYSAPKVGDIMTKKVMSVTSDERFDKVKKLLAQKDMGSILITKGEEILGIFTEFDIVSEYYMNPNRLKGSFMSDFMNSPVVCITPDFDIFTANKMMIEKNFRRLPILENGKLVGIITQTDIANSIYDYLLKNKEKSPEKPKDYKEQKYSSEKKGNIILMKLK